MDVTETLIVASRAEWRKWLANFVKQTSQNKIIGGMD
jgi:hypothetical protein